MDRDRFVSLSFVAFGLVVASFVTLGLTRLVVGYRTGLVLAAPFGLLGFGLVVWLFGVSVWTTIRGASTADSSGGDEESETSTEGSSGGAEKSETTEVGSDGAGLESGDRS